MTTQYWFSPTYSSTAAPTVATIATVAAPPAPQPFRHRLENPRNKTVTRDDFAPIKLDVNGDPMPRQRVKVGQVVRVKRSQADWGNVRILDSYVGIVLARGDDNTIVLPLAGPAGNSASLLVAQSSLNAYREGDLSASTAAHFATSYAVSNRCVTLINPARLNESWLLSACLFRNLLGAATANQRIALMYERLRANERNQRFARCRKWGMSSRGYYNARGGYGPQRNFNRAKTVRLYMCMMVSWTTDTPTYIGPITDSAAAGQASAAMKKKYPASAARYELREYGCGHYGPPHTQDPRPFGAVYRDAYDTRHSCPDCFAAATPALDHRGRTVHVSPTFRLHEWSDGTQRVGSEPGVIDGYHSSRSKVSLMPTLDCRPYTGFTMGMELEIQSHREDQVDLLARQVRNAVLAAAPEAWTEQEATPSEHSQVNPPWAFFERDGSVNPGFEIVTSYGDIAVHRHFVYKVFGHDAAGKLPWAGKLRSHDATCSCGLHVHMVKPNSVLHAAKLQAFYNDPGMKRLVVAVARRWDVGYAKLNLNKRAEMVRSEATVAARHVAGWRVRSRLPRGREPIAQHMVSDAISSMSNSDGRYSAVNFKNTATVEIRIFRGTMQPTTIMACLELARASWFFARDSHVAEVTEAGFLAWLARPENLADTKALRSYLAIKGFAVFTHAKSRVIVEDETPAETAEEDE